MRIRLLAFASAADALGTGETEIDLPDGSRLSDLRAPLRAEHPALVPVWPRLAVAVDGHVVSSLREPIHEGAEIALLPPVSGGVEGEGDAAAAGRAALAALVDGP